MVACRPDGSTRSSKAKLTSSEVVVCEQETPPARATGNSKRQQLWRIGSRSTPGASYCATGGASHPSAALRPRR